MTSGTAPATGDAARPVSPRPPRAAACPPRAEIAIRQCHLPFGIRTRTQRHLVVSAVQRTAAAGGSCPTGDRHRDRRHPVLNPTFQFSQIPFIGCLSLCQKSRTALPVPPLRARLGLAGGVKRDSLLRGQRSATARSYLQIASVETID